MTGQESNSSSKGLQADSKQQRPDDKPNPKRSISVAGASSTKRVSQKTTPKKRAASIGGGLSSGISNPQKKEKPSPRTSTKKRSVSVSVGPLAVPPKPTSDDNLGNLAVPAAEGLAASVASRYLEAIQTPKAPNAKAVSSVPSGSNSRSFSEDDTTTESSVSTASPVKKSQGLKNERCPVVYPSSPNPSPEKTSKLGNSTEETGRANTIPRKWNSVPAGGALASSENGGPKKKVPNNNDDTKAETRKSSTKPVSIPKIFESAAAGDAAKNPILSKKKQEANTSLKSPATSKEALGGGPKSSLGSSLENKESSSETEQTKSASNLELDKSSSSLTKAVAANIPESLVDMLPTKVSQLRRMYGKEERATTEGASSSSQNQVVKPLSTKSTPTTKDSRGDPVPRGGEVDKEQIATGTTPPTIQTSSTTQLSKKESEDFVNHKACVSGGDQTPTRKPQSQGDESPAVISPSNVAQLDIEALKEGKKRAESSRQVIKSKSKQHPSSSDSRKLDDYDIEQPDTLLPKPSLADDSVSGPLMDYPIDAKGGRYKKPRKWWILALVLIVACGAAAAALMTTGVIGESTQIDTSALEDQLGYLSSDVSIFRDASSPQSRAVNWLAIENEVEEKDKKRIEARYALAVLYYSTGGPSFWRDDLGFLSKAHECDWTRSFGTVGVGCDQSGRIVNVRIISNNLIGSIPEELRALSDLTILDLSNNGISGTIPTLEYHDLDYLNLANNRLSGSLPTSIGILTSLKSLDLSLNSLTSTLPATLGVLTNLNFFHFGQNRIVGTVPEGISSLILLEELNMTRNMLSGSIGFIQNLTRVESLDLSYNQFEFTIPERIGILKALTRFDFSHNQLQGTMPSSIGDLTALELLACNENSISGTFPWKTFTENSHLKKILMANNKLSGSFPSQQVTIDATLEVIDLSGNMLSGKLPAWDLVSLRDLRLSRNIFTGTVPESFGLMTAISRLDLSANFLSNTIPPFLENLSSLEWLALDGNSLSGEVPTELSNLEKLERLSLQQNDLLGDANFLCASKASDAMPIISADCGGDLPEVKCSCCSLCV